MKKLWARKRGKDAIPQVTGAGGLLFVAESENQRVSALDMETGREKWALMTEGRVALPPTYHKGTCLFGDNAGWVYCLEAASGRLIWQLQAAPEQKYMGAFSRFESSWPVKSGVLVVEDVAYFIAGRCRTMDGGLYLYGVDAASGQVRVKRNFNDIRPTDILRSDGRTLFFGSVNISPGDDKDKRSAGVPKQRVLVSGRDSNGLTSILDMLESLDSGLIGARKRALSDGRGEGELVAFDKDRSVVSGRRPRAPRAKETLPFTYDGHCRVFCKGVSEVLWVNKDTAQQMQALMLAGPRVYCAGIPETRDSEDKPALWIISATDGKELQRIPLDSAPNIDGLSAVGGKVFLTTVDGQVVCYGAK